MAINERTDNEARRNLQGYLRQLAYFDDSIPLVPIDGVAGDDTAEAIRAFQRGRGLPVTGVADRETWEAIYGEYLVSLENAAPPSRFSPFPAEPADYALREGDEGFPVSALQFMLEEIALFFPISAVDVDGKYGPETRDAVSELQARYLLPVTGETDKLTWNAIVRLYDSAKLYK